MANVLVDEVEQRPIELPVTAIRDAIADIIPKDDNIVSDVKIHDGLVEVLIRWRSLRWNTSLAIHQRTPDQLAEKIDDDFRTWLRATIKNMNAVPRHARVLGEMVKWLRENQDKKDWLYGDAA
jgi:hypothetical protein